MNSTEEILQKVLSKAHAGHQYTTDSEQYGLPEYWKAQLKGDCEDFALWIKRELKYVHSIAVDLVFCEDENGGGHLVVHHDGWILDNRYPYIMESNTLKYRWILIHPPEGFWYEVGQK